MAKRRVRRASSAGGPRKHIELRPVRKQVERTIAKLERVEQPNQKVRRALQKMRQCIKDIRSICGPVMDIPLR